MFPLYYSEYNLMHNSREKLIISTPTHPARRFRRSEIERLWARRPSNAAEASREPTVDFVRPFQSRKCWLLARHPESALLALYKDFCTRFVTDSK